MNAYFVQTDDVEALKTALGRMIECAKDFAGCKEREDFVDTILEEEGIEVTVESYD